MKQFRRLIAVLIAAALAPVTLLAQEAATVTGRVTNAQGQPEAAVLVRIESLNAGASTGADGTYRLVIPGARIRAGQNVQITASRQGLSPVSRSVTLSPGANLTQNFQMSTQIILLEDVVVTGTAGAVEVAKLPFTVGRVDGEDLQVPAVSAGGVEGWIEADDFPLEARGGPVTVSTRDRSVHENGRRRSLSRRAALPGRGAAADRPRGAVPGVKHGRTGWRCIPAHTKVMSIGSDPRRSGR
mgnify:CR=1 FL=1